jgi:predicted metal-dependent enzyme (double-stranded beta helix superfamily)
VFDLDAFLAACQTAARDPEPRLAIRDVVAHAVSTPDDVGEALRPTEGGITVLHSGTDVTVLHVVWAPRMQLYPHDHRMWAAIGVYSGQEDNAFFRRSGPERRGLTRSGAKELRERDVVVLGDDTIHSVTNPVDRLTAAIHVYGGDFVSAPRSQWPPDAYEEQPYDLTATLEQFAAANLAWRSRN